MTICTVLQATFSVSLDILAPEVHQSSSRLKMVCLAERCRMVDVRNNLGVQSDPPALCPEAWKNLPFVDIPIENSDGALQWHGLVEMVPIPMW
jgi:hypothetical protein